MFKNLRKKIARLIPGSEINIAQAKRRMEKDLQKQGLSRSHAQAIVAQHFAEQSKYLSTLHS